MTAACAVAGGDTATSSTPAASTIAAGMQPGSTTALVFEVADPGKNAVAFEFKFR